MKKTVVAKATESIKKWVSITLIVLNLLLVGAAALLSFWFFVTDWQLLVSLLILVVLLGLAWIQINYAEPVNKQIIMCIPDYVPWVVTHGSNVIFKTKQKGEQYEAGDIVVHKYRGSTFSGIRKIRSITRSENPDFSDHIMLEINPAVSYSLGSTENIRHATADEILQYIRDREDEEHQRAYESDECE